MTRNLPSGGLVDRLRRFSFPLLRYPNYGALTSTPAGLFPAEHASLHWTHNRTCSFPAYGSHLGCLTAGLAAFRTRSGACDTLSRHCVRYVRHRFAFSLASALCSTASAAGHPALFGGFVATMAESDFSCPCIIGFGSSPSRCGPVGSGDGSERLGLRNILSFVAQSPTPSDHCVRFAPAVADDHATLASRRRATTLPGPVFHRLERVSFA